MILKWPKLTKIPEKKVRVISNNISFGKKSHNIYIPIFNDIPPPHMKTNIYMGR